MPELSPRITSLNDGGSDGWEVFYKARALKAQGIDVTELTIGEHDIRTDAAILDAMHKAAKSGHTGYAIVPGIPALREAIAKRLTERTGVPTTPDNIHVTPGGQAALFAAHMATLQPGDKALFIDPYYATYPGTIRAASGEPVAVKTRAENAFLPETEMLHEAARTSQAKTLLINTPNNPTGTIYPAETLHDIARTCIDHDLWLISDEVYDTQVWEGAHLSPRSVPGMAERTLVIGSMSKSHAMTGSRIGWIAAPEHVIPRLVDLAVTTTYGVPGYIQDAALFALGQGTPLEAQISEPFKRRRALVLAQLTQQDTVSAIPSQGAMYLMLDVRRTGLSGEAFAHALLDTHRIAVMPGESFGQAAAGHIRIALTIPDERLETAVKTLCAFAEAKAGATAAA
jgi:arginine:pyruvate transaminase